MNEDGHAPRACDDGMANGASHQIVLDLPMVGESRMAPFLNARCLMLRWRTLILAIVLVLGLPFRFADAAQMPCHAASAGAAATVLEQTQHAMKAHTQATPSAVAIMAPGERSHACRGSMTDRHPSGQCGMNAPCCGGALPAAQPRIDAPALSMLFVIRVVSDPASPFLTDGVDRPPRPALV